MDSTWTKIKIEIRLSLATRFIGWAFNVLPNSQEKWELAKFIKDSCLFKQTEE